jgi:hypothetical protein
MLQKPDVHTAKILDLANFIENLPNDSFSMGSWGLHGEPRCICGWYNHNNAHMEHDDWANAADGLGLTDDVAKRLFTSRTLSQQQAAKTLRHLAVTGELVFA